MGLEIFKILIDIFHQNNFRIYMIGGTSRDYQMRSNAEKPSAKHPIQLCDMRPCRQRRVPRAPFHHGWRNRMAMLRDIGLSCLYTIAAPSGRGNEDD